MPATPLISEAWNAGAGLMVPTYEFKPENIETAIKEIFIKHSPTGTADFDMYDPGHEELCKMFVVAKYGANVRTAHMFTNFSNSTRLDRKCTAYQAAHATSAAPTFFPPIMINAQTFIDGGLGYNHPTYYALDQDQLLANDSQLHCLVSLGTGQEALIPGVGSNLQLVKSMSSLVTECDITTENVSKTLKRNQRLNRYFRLNAPGMANIKLGEWEEAGTIVGLTEVYMEKEHPKAMVGKAARLLLRQETLADLTSPYSRG
ncbi:FabD/lysophospholipase-like protein [Atractiella rhizophila]|nr:FabD/lysophospholipase-like protein [Atractiella rhizophila]